MSRKRKFLRYWKLLYTYLQKVNTIRYDKGVKGNDSLSSVFCLFVCLSYLQKLRLLISTYIHTFKITLITLHNSRVEWDI